MNAWRSRRPGRASLSALVLAIAWGAPARAAEQAAETGASTQATFEVRHEWLDGALDDWRSVRLGIARTGAWTPGWYGALVREERFGQVDAAIEAGGILPLDDHWMVQAEAGATPAADFLPHGHAELTLVRRLPSGWVASAAVRRARYPTATVDRVSMDIERYVGAWRFAYGYDRARLHGASLGSHAFALDRYLGERDVVGLRLGKGTEATQRPDGTLIATDTTSAWLRGTCWVSRTWAVDWAAGTVAQDGSYDRGWIQLGLRHEL